MVQQMYSIFDTKASLFGGPFFAFNDGVAQRNVAASVRGGDSLLSKFPEDYQLFRVGAFDDQSGIVEPAIPAVHVCNLSSLTSKG